MKKLLLLFVALAITGFATACHDHDRGRHTPITTTTTTEESSTHIAPSSSSTVVHSSY
jgi:multidrug resistance efflux pump